MKIPIFFFHVSKNAREKYEFEESLFSISGNLIIASFSQARIFSQKINQKREEENIFDNYVSAGQINALGLLHEIFHKIIRKYEDEENPGVFNRSLIYLQNKVGENDLNKLLKKFLEEFPPVSILKNEISIDEYLQSSSINKSNKEIIIEELILLHLENSNPLFNSLKELFDDKPLHEQTNYKQFIDETERFFELEKPTSIDNLSLIKTLKKSFLQNTSSIDEQFEYIRKFWNISFEKDLDEKLLTGSDLIKEDEKIFVKHGFAETPPVPEYKIEPAKYEQVKIEEEKGLQVESIDEVTYSYHFEGEQFTEDIDWMPKVVMLAKNIFVWLDQLSKKYEREIKHLDQIPDEELDQIQAWNFTALWLIGIWERSPASKKIKQFIGFHDAASSAYSLYDYEIADELGGENSFNNLKHRCGVRGIKLSSDMVPNHCGIFSKWIINHPEFFIQSDFPPYPNYHFTGPDLSDDLKIQIRIEDKYYTMKDAAVVFQLIENSTGKIRYIYHGNDGTNMPWNDTAQLNILRDDVREALIKMIMHVADKTPIIRFDAAMTLAKKHFQRLWYPKPGTGGAIPSRSDYAMTKNFFNELLPNEFWREVVDRINAEMPNTLLLAEAFWLMESYFVRTLGMHRVYNSAFMHMFMKEENKKYKKLLTNTLEFNPEILKRYVNFMSNPDEETAVNQFGKGDKYFGVCVMMVTLPGLPMFAHGQIEGFSEKYGMEYKRAYYKETIDDYLIKMHEDEIFPLTKKRHLFSQVVNFELYDFIDENDVVNENVFAFTNKAGNERALVFYNNSYTSVKGKIYLSTGKAASNEKDEIDSVLKIKSLNEALDLKTNENYYYKLREHKTKLEYLKSAKDLNDDGFTIQLNGYQYCVFLDFKELYDLNGDYKRLHKHLDGKGVVSVEQTLLEMNLTALHNYIIDLFNRENLNELKEFCFLNDKKESDDETLTSQKSISKYLRGKISLIINELKNFQKIKLDEDDIINRIEEDFNALKHFYLFAINEKNEKSLKIIKSIKENFVLFDKEKSIPYKDIILIYNVIKRIVIGLHHSSPNNKALEFYDSLLLEKPLWQSLIRLGEDYSVIKQEFDLLKILASSESIFIKNDKKLSGKEKLPLVSLLEREEVKYFIGFNNYNGINYFGKENFELLFKWNYSIEFIRRIEKEMRNFVSDKSSSTVAIELVLKNKKFKSSLKKMNLLIENLKEFSIEAGYNYDLLLKKINRNEFIKKKSLKKKNN